MCVLLVNESEDRRERERKQGKKEGRRGKKAGKEEREVKLKRGELRR